MGSKKFRRVICGLVSALMLISSVPLTASAADQNKRGMSGQYSYEMWNKDSTGEAEMEPDTNSFTCSWEDIEECIFGMGKNFDTQKRSYDQLSLNWRCLDYEMDYFPKGDSFMAVHGWTRNPLVEYYIVEAWGAVKPSPTYSTAKDCGSYILNGNTYDLYMNMVYNQPSLDGTASFPQYWSIRKENPVKNNQNNHIKGVVSFYKHFKTWEQLGLDMTGTLYEVCLYFENHHSCGSADVEKVLVGGLDSSTPVRIIRCGTNSPNPRLNYTDIYGYYQIYDFDLAPILDWSPYYDCNMSVSENGYYESESDNCVLVSDRIEEWDGPVLPISHNFFPGDTISFGASVMQDTEEATDFILTVMYTDENGSDKFDEAAAVRAKKGEWTDLSTTSYTIPEGAQNTTIRIETTGSNTDFFIDNAYVAEGGVQSYMSRLNEQMHDYEGAAGDLNDDGVVDVFDLAPLRRMILNLLAGIGQYSHRADINSDGIVNVADLVCLQRFLLGAQKLPDPSAETTTAISEETTTTTTTTTTSSKTTKVNKTTTSSTISSTTTTSTPASSGSYDFDAQYIFTHARKLMTDETFPKTKMIGSRAELEEYIAENEENYDFYDQQNWFSGYSVPFSEAVEKYSDEWFKSHKLIIILHQETFINNECHKVTNVTRDKVEIELLKNGGDMAICYWHFLIGLDKDADVSDDFEVVMSDYPTSSDHSFGSIA